MAYIKNLAYELFKAGAITLFIRGVLLFLSWQKIHPEIWVASMLNQIFSTVISHEAASWMIAGLCGVVGCVIWEGLVKSHKESEIGNLPKKLLVKGEVKFPALIEVYNADFPYTGSINIDKEVIVANSDGKEFHRVKLHFRVHPDFEARADYVSVFIPRSDLSLLIAKTISNEIRKFYEEIKASILVSSKKAGEINFTHSNELVFSNRVFLYHEDTYSLQEMASIEAGFHSQNLDVRFRGTDHQAVRWNQMREK